MPDLSFSFQGVESVPYAAVPMLAARLHIANEPAKESIHSIILRCQVQIEPGRRRYLPAEQERLHDLFGEPARWARSVRPMLWMNTSVSVPAFTGETAVDLHLPCTFDFTVAAAKYFHALESGDVPITVMFSGTVFFADDDGRLQAAQISWDKEASFRLAASMWQKLMDDYYPNGAWFWLQREVFERLLEYKVNNAIPTFEQTVQELLQRAEELTASSQSAGGVQQ